MHQEELVKPNLDYSDSKMIRKVNFIFIKPNYEQWCSLSVGKKYAFVQKTQHCFRFQLRTFNQTHFSQFIICMMGIALRIHFKERGSLFASRMSAPELFELLGFLRASLVPGSIRQDAGIQALSMMIEPGISSLKGFSEQALGRILQMQKEAERGYGLPETTQCQQKNWKEHSSLVISTSQPFP